MVRSRFGALALGAASLALVMSACGSDDEGSAASDGAKADGGAAKDGYSVVFIPQNLGIPYFDRMAVGFKEAAEAKGFDFTMVGPTTADASAQIPVIQAQIQKQVDAIAIQVSDENAEKPVLEQARAQGIKVVAVNSNQLEGTRDGAVTPVDFLAVGPQMLENLAEQMDYSGEFGIVSATTTAPFQQKVIKDVKHALATDPKYKDMKIAKIVYGNDDPHTSATQTEALLSAEPDIKAVFAPTNVGTAAAAKVIQSRGLSGKMILAGNCSPDEVRKYIEDGTIKACQLWDPKDHAKAAGYLIDGLIQGTLNSDPGTTFDVPGLETQTVGDDGVVISASKLTTFDKSNIDDYRGF